MKKILAMLVALLTLLPAAFAISIGDGIGVSIETEEFEPLVWMCDSRVVLDDDTERLKILEADEIEAVFGLPIFDDDDRAFYFSLLPPEKALLSQLHGHKSYIY